MSDGANSMNIFAISMDVDTNSEGIYRDTMHFDLNSRTISLPQCQISAVQCRLTWLVLGDNTAKIDKMEVIGAFDWPESYLFT